jgi:hypothetical protein
LFSKGEEGGQTALEMPALAGMAAASFGFGDDTGVFSFDGVDGAHATVESVRRAGAMARNTSFDGVPDVFSSNGVPDPDAASGRRTGEVASTASDCNDDGNRACGLILLTLAAGPDAILPAEGEAGPPTGDAAAASCTKRERGGDSRGPKLKGLSPPFLLMIAVGGGDDVVPEPGLR